MNPLLPVLVLLCLSATVMADCHKVSNATDCASYSDVQSQLQIVPVETANPLEFCVKIIFNKVCLKIDNTAWTNYFDNITLSITVDDKTIWSVSATIPELMTPEGLCIDDDTVLEILLEIPSLYGDAKTIMEILKAIGCRPEGLFSMCFSFTPCASTLQQQVHGLKQQLFLDQGRILLPVVPSVESSLCGCFDFTFQALYYRKWCVYKDQSRLGCVGEGQ
eukprot:TRINITY_DN4041_c0_g1_i1.p2 TRINITY_DN4041_c0_g1~~TRINITY_DN4041_c0_g1_i1.p2  ORF type:complete len:247 (-),score=121.64 TRINITY_DN4041_c0_g1_i1:127-786(-)